MYDKVDWYSRPHLLAVRTPVRSRMKGETEGKAIKNYQRTEVALGLIKGTRVTSPRATSNDCWIPLPSLNKQSGELERLLYRTGKEMSGHI